MIGFHPPQVDGARSGETHFEKQDLGSDTACADAPENNPTKFFTTVNINLYIYYSNLNLLTQSKSKIQYQEVRTVSSILLPLTLIGYDMAFKSITISLQFHYLTQ